MIKTKKEYVLAFVSTLLGGMLTHIYAMVNPLYNSDAIKMRNMGLLGGGISW